MIDVFGFSEDVAEQGSPRIFRGTTPIDCVSASDRGLAYGDGLFETMRGSDGVVPWWSRHWRRLQRGGERLHLPLPPEALAKAEAEQLLAGAGGVVKLLLTRGSGGRGYRPPDHPEPVWIVSRHPNPPPSASMLTARWCRTRLSLQPALAGLKHCNRLEQVLALAERHTGDDLDSWPVSEGLMRSMNGDVVCATSANVFVRHQGRWSTPVIDRCGVEGTMREWLLEELPVVQARLSIADVESADALVLVNAVRGILQVGRLGGRAWTPHPAVADLRRRLSIAHPAFPLPPPGPDPLELS